jgi:hypothetical protein
MLTQARKKIFELGGANGIRTITHLLRRMDFNGNGCLDRTELYEGLKAFGLTELTCTPGGDMVDTSIYYRFAYCFHYCSITRTEDNDMRW